MVQGFRRCLNNKTGASFYFGFVGLVALLLRPMQRYNISPCGLRAHTYTTYDWPISKNDAIYWPGTIFSAFPALRVHTPFCSYSVGTCDIAACGCIHVIYFIMLLIGPNPLRYRVSTWYHTLHFRPRLAAFTRSRILCMPGLTQQGCCVLPYLYAFRCFGIVFDAHAGPGMLLRSFICRSFSDCSSIWCVFGVTWSLGGLAFRLPDPFFVALPHVYAIYR